MNTALQFARVTVHFVKPIGDVEVTEKDWAQTQSSLLIVLHILLIMHSTLCL